MPSSTGKYSRTDIHEKHQGDSKTSYLPMRDNRVVCACVRLDFNPDAPEVILAGNDEDVRNRALVLCQQGGSIPVYVSEAGGEYRFKGNYEVRGYSDDSTAIAKRMANDRRKKRVPVSRIIYLSPVKPK